MRRVLMLAAVVVAAALLQSTVLAELRLAGVRPDLLVLSVVAVAMASGPTSGAVFGFSAGLVADLLFDLPVGVSALVYTAVGFAVGTVRVYVTSHRPLVHLALAGAASLAAVWCSGLLLRVFDLSSWAAVARSGPLVALYNLLLAPFVYPVVRNLAERVPAKPAQRW
ncbi:MAG TPA: rod shape-determining protein MreD [Actinomycetes bacterium]|nr:rod shape-determining protein MreD [Actinomycetes bacterium]